MIQLLGEHLDAFEGTLGRVRCFAHVVNLVVKTLLRQFDVPKAKAAQALNEEDTELYELAAEENDAADTAQVEGSEDGAEIFGLELDDPEGWVDEIAAMSDDERAEFEEKVRPVRLVLTKVSFSRVWVHARDERRTFRSASLRAKL